MSAKIASSIVAGILATAVLLSTTAAERPHDQARQGSTVSARTLVDDQGHSYGLAEMRYRERPAQRVDEFGGGLADTDVRVRASIAEVEPASTVKLYWPAGQGSHPVLVPVIVYFREAGTADSDAEHVGAARALATSAEAVVVSVRLRVGSTAVTDVDFRGGHDQDAEQAYEAYQWALANAGGLGGDPRHVAVMGEGLAGPVAMTVAARARHAQLPAPYYLVLVNAPATSVAIQPATARAQPSASPRFQDITWPTVSPRSARSTDKNYRAM